MLWVIEVKCIVIVVDDRIRKENAIFEVLVVNIETRFGCHTSSICHAESTVRQGPYADLDGGRKS